MKYLIVGLGNIGPEYHETRHNIGFMAVDALAKAAGATFTDGRYGFTTTLSVKGRQLLLLKPSTFMNLSGNAVRYWMQKENIPLENVLVVVDDLALPFGTLRLKGKGSDAGHNGLKHIASTLGTQNYARLRFGIGNDFPRGGQIRVHCRVHRSVFPLQIPPVRALPVAALCYGLLVRRVRVYSLRKLCKYCLPMLHCLCRTEDTVLHRE